jgi:hypothetical protein
LPGQLRSFVRSVASTVLLGTRRVTTVEYTDELQEMLLTLVAALSDNPTAVEGRPDAAPPSTTNSYEAV